MKRRLILLAIVIVFIAISANFAISPPSLIDAITGATPKSRARNATVQVAPASYILVKNTEADLSSENSVCLAIIDGDKYLKSRAEMLAEEYKSAGITLEIEEYSEVMLISRALAGKYDLLLLPAPQMPLPEFPNAEYTDIPNIEQGE